MTIYTHPNIEKFNQYSLYLETLRNKRLVLAIEHDKARQKRNRAMLSALAKKWDTLDHRIADDIEKARILLSKIDTNLMKMSDINHQISIAEES